MKSMSQKIIDLTKNDNELADALNLVLSQTEHQHQSLARLVLEMTETIKDMHHEIQLLKKQFGEKK